MSTANSILVLGAGELGNAVLHSLAEHPERNHAQVTALRRSHSDNDNGSDITVAAADLQLSTTEDLAKIFEAFHTVVNCSGMALTPETQVKIAQAALQAGVKRYFPWQFGGDYDRIGRGSAQPLFDLQLDVRDLLRSQSAMKWVIVSTGMFTPFVFEPAFGMVSADKSTVTALGSWDTKITVTSPQDIGKIVAELVFNHPMTEGILHAAGDTITASDVADIVANVTQKAVKRQLIGLDALKGELAADPDDHMKRYRVIFAIGVGTSWCKARSWNVQHGIETETAAEWAKKQL